MGEFFIDFFELAILSGTSDPTRLVLSGKKLLLSSLTFPRSVKKEKKVWCFEWIKVPFVAK
jgi:hypothetical protein